MAIDKAIDSAKEAACRTAEADAIREKLGSSDPISYDFAGGQGFAAAISQIPQGGGATEPYVEETYDEDGFLTAAKLYGYTKVRNYAFYNCDALALTSLPSSLTSIGNFAFSGCTSLALTSLPSSLTSIGNSAFYNCDALALTSLPSSLTSIGDYAFYNCDDSVTVQAIPAGVTTIGRRAFGFCYGLTQMRFYGTPTSIASDAFYRCDDLTDIYVPWASGEVDGAPWGAENATVHYAGEENA